LSLPATPFTLRAALLVLNERENKNVSETVSEAVGIPLRLKHQADQLLADAAQCRPAARIGLMTTLYFKQGHCAQTRQRIEACFAHFHETFRPFLKWQTYVRLRKLSPSSFATCRRQVLEASANEPLSWSISSGKPVEAASHCLSVVTAPECQAQTDHSCLKMLLPLSMLMEQGGAKAYEGWLKYLCNQTLAEHGYGGPVCVMPGEGLRYLPLQYRLAQDYIGLMVDAGPHIESLRLLNRIKGVSWYNILGNRFVSQLGGSDRLRRALSSHSDIVFQAYENGLMIRAGVLPDLGSKGEAPPNAYVAVNKLLKPIRVQDTGCLHPYPVRGIGFTAQSTAQWYSRFDEKPLAAVRAGQPCPQTGHWFSSAMARSRRFFNKGDVMPAFEHLKAERTQWFWAEVGG
jgi:hypothetical protein